MPSHRRSTSPPSRARRQDKANKKLLQSGFVLYLYTSYTVYTCENIHTHTHTLLYIRSYSKACIVKYSYDDDVYIAKNT